MLEMNGTVFRQLPKFEEKIDYPDVSHCVIEETDSGHTQRFDIHFGIKGEHQVVSFEHNMRAAQATVDVNGKAYKSFHAKNLEDCLEVPYNFELKGHKVTLKKQTDEDGEELDGLDVLIDGVEFYKHPFISKERRKFDLSDFYKEFRHTLMRYNFINLCCSVQQ